jgi:hypothetical protein
MILIGQPQIDTRLKVRSGIVSFIRAGIACRRFRRRIKKHAVFLLRMNIVPGVSDKALKDDWRCY